MPLQERQNFAVIGEDSLGKLPQVAQNVGPSMKAAAGYLSEHERMHQNLVIQQGLLEVWIAFPEVIHPYGGIHKKHGCAYLIRGCRSSLTGASPPACFEMRLRATQCG